MSIYPRHDRFVAPARLRPALWRLLAGLVVSLVVYVLVITVILTLAWLTLDDPDGAMDIEDVVVADTPQKLLVLLTTFVGMALGPMVAVRLLHKRGAGTLFGYGPHVLKDFVVASATVGALFTLSFLGWSIFFDAVPGQPVGEWLWILPVALICVLIQTGAEEILFRGYLQQQLAARFASPLVWMVVPSLAFGLVHFDPEGAGATAWIVVGSAGIFGFVAADLTARTGSIGAAWGFHFANNVIALLVIATEGSLTGLALYRTPYDLSDVTAILPLIAVDLFFILLAWVLVRRFVSR